MSIRPSPSKSKVARPVDIDSTMYRRPLEPSVWTKVIPLSAVTSRN
jgi:hypothetical protein